MSGIWELNIPDDESGQQESSANRLVAFREVINAMINIRRMENRISGTSSQGSNNLLGVDEEQPREFSIEEFAQFLDQMVQERGQDIEDADEETQIFDENEEDNEDEESDEDEEYVPSHVSQRWHEPVTKPKQAGMDLLYSGEFGRIKHQTKSRSKDHNMAKFLLNRGSKVRPSIKEDFAADLIPNTNGTAVARYLSNAYVGQFSSDSSFYYTCVRDFQLHVYDTAAPITPAGPATVHRRQAGRGVMMNQDHVTSMKVIKTIQAHPGGWTITDSHLSPDNQRMIYASVSNIVYMASTVDSSLVQVPINFSDPPRRNGRDPYEDHYGIWSCKFSADGNEVIAGGTKRVFVYDLLAEKRTVKIKAHDDDINSCCWADTASGNILVSASDDTFLKVWDRRSLGSSPKPSGVLIGHTEGITYVSAKGDGRYVISNGKDQVLRLWDLRKMRSSIDYEDVRGDSYGIYEFDYRRNSYPRPRYKAHPLDCSVMQYTGHEVLRTLIRCHFSPAETTGGQYIYSGGADGRIHIWSLDGRVVQVLDRTRTLAMSFDPSEPQFAPAMRHSNKVCVRDVSWHSQQPVLMSAGWLGERWGSHERSEIARHEWKGLSKMGYSLSDHVERESLELAERESAQQRRMFMPGTYSLVQTDDDIY